MNDVTPNQAEAIILLFPETHAVPDGRFADGAKHEREREQIRRIAESFRGSGGGPLRASPGGAAARTGARQLAYELALGCVTAEGPAWLLIQLPWSGGDAHVKGMVNRAGFIASRRRA